MNYELRHGDYGSALHDLLENGGQLFSSTHPDGANTILRGQICITYWKPNSRLFAQVNEASRQFGFEHPAPTAGRLARHVLRSVIDLPCDGTYFGKGYAQLARDGNHWHYQHVVTGYHPFLVEFDLKSAYFTSLFHGKSLLFHERKGWMDDNGALDRLKSITPILPKWLRLTLLGVLASHKSQFYTRGKDENDNFVLNLKTVKKIKYGAAFNAAHKAINRTYKCMERVHSIGGDYIKRIHTDSFAIPPTIPEEKEVEILEFLAKHNYQVAIKASGASHFLNLNEGLIGNKVIGMWQSVREQFREQKVKIPKYNFDSESLQRWKDRISIQESSEDEPSTAESMCQLSLL